uniref:Internal scaffolding protein n=1 Tax=Dulem virus 113 TaxID=3145590 RepID=A0AAU8B9Y9_9VIRU
MKFKTQYDSHDRVSSNPGDPIKILYAPEFDKNGVMNLVESGKENLYDFIQSHAQSVDIHVLLQQYQNGDAMALTRRQGAFGDFTEMPATYAEALNAMIHAESYFNSLPVETRAQFGHSFHQFLAQMDSPEFSAKMGISPTPLPEQPVASPTESPTVPPVAPATNPAEVK